MYSTLVHVYYALTNCIYYLFHHSIFRQEERWFRWASISDIFFLTETRIWLRWRKHCACKLSLCDSGLIKETARHTFQAKNRLYSLTHPDHGFPTTRSLLSGIVSTCHPLSLILQRGNATLYSLRYRPVTPPTHTRSSFRPCRHSLPSSRHTLSFPSII